ncbi:hypothetical protein P3T76_013461 [Phytophthora citrophthora]|uniref:Uncharacterized protein n=1 Tax=Phytophthora citrophthora TaxID=4793 RepID=A0AAD9G4F0_9STRA|nr:hypothetical protein P3T76_013461 [Phytophthora citrophthora]
MTPAPSPPVHIAAGSFFRYECDHEQLFHSEYKRSNRTKGLKILRCFPHCCPEHIDRSYCGSPLSVSIRLAECPTGTAPSEPLPSEALSVFARFESVSDVSLRTGECVEVSKIQQGVQTDTNLEGQWIAGVLDGPSDLVTNIRAPNTSPRSENPLVFHLNSKKAYSRWYYDWESGANKAQRLLKHVLKAYVVDRVAVDMDDNLTVFSSPEAFTQLYRVAHVVTSPEFTVISYRRAPLEPLHATEGSAPLQLTTAQIPQQVERGLLSAGRGLPHKQALNGRPGMVSVFAPTEPASVIPVARVEYEESQTPLETPLHPLEDKWFREDANGPAVSTSKNLALLYAILRWAPLRFYSPFVEELLNLLQQNLLDPISATSEINDKRNCFVELLFDHTRAEDELSAAGSPPVSQQVNVVLQTAAQAAVWLYSREMCHWVRAFFQQYAVCVLDKKQLRACYLQFLSEIEKRLNTEVFAATMIGSLANAAEEVIAAVYSCQYFQDRRPLVRQILGGQNFVGWNMFVAQLRDTFIGATSLPRGVESQDRATFAAAYPPHNVIEECWNGEWVLDMATSSYWSAGADNASQNVSLYSLVTIISHIVHIEVSIDIQESALRLRSTRGVAGRLDCMHVVLDNKERVFRLFPNGITSSGLEGMNGDYIGEIRVEEPRNMVAFLEMFHWAVEKGERSYHVRLCMESQQSGHLSVNGDILATTGSSSFTAEEIPYVGEMSLRMKRKMVEKAYAEESQTADAPAWREHSRFHLSYCKVEVTK